MGFEALLGNERLKADLSAARQKGRMAHFYLISGPEGSGKKTLADLLAAAMLCQSQEAPCGVCKSCRKVFSRLHPDDITVDDPEKKIVPVQLIREARADIYIRPNEGSRKIYRFPRGQDMNVESQNALLKVLEEPPAYGVFLILTTNPEAMLPTVRSRCVELKLRALPQDILAAQLRREFPEAKEADIAAAAARSGGWLGQAKALLESSGLSPQAELFCRAFLTKDLSCLMQALVPMEKWKRDALIPELELWLQVVEQALLARSGMSATVPQARELARARSSAELMAAANALKKAIEYAGRNVSCGAVCGWLEFSLR